MKEGIPKEHQIDWEGILTAQSSDFVATISAWLRPSLVPSSLLDGLDEVDSCITTFRQMIECMNSQA